jgi:hypothetical protein
MRLKSELYAQEQREICDRVIEILCLDEQSSVWLADLDSSVDKQRSIMALVPDIRKYYSYTAIEGANLPEKCQRPWLSIIRAVTRPYYTWSSTDLQRNRKRAPRYFLVAKDDAPGADSVA